MFNKILQNFLNVAYFSMTMSKWNFKTQCKDTNRTKTCRNATAIQWQQNLWIYWKHEEFKSAEVSIHVNTRWIHDYIAQWLLTVSQNPTDPTFIPTYEYKYVNKCLWKSNYIYKLNPFQIQAEQTNYSSHWFACIVVLSVLCTRCTFWFLSGFSIVLWSDSNYLLACTLEALNVNGILS